MAKAKSKTQNASYSQIVEGQEFQKRFNAVRKYVREINKIVGSTPGGGGLYSMTGVIGGSRNKQPDVQSLSERTVGKGGYIATSKAGAIAARKTKVLRGTQNKAK